TPGPDPTTSPTDPPPEKVPVDLAVAVPGSKVTVGSGTKYVRVDVANLGYGTARNVTLTIEVGELTEDVTVELPDRHDGCQNAETKAICSLPDLMPDDGDSHVTFR